MLFYSTAEQTTEVTADYTSTESDITDTSQVTPAIALTELTGTDTDISIVFKMTIIYNWRLLTR